MSTDHAATEAVLVRAAQEAVLVRAAQQGDLRSFEVLVRRHSRQMYRVARRAGLSEAAAEDALQVVWIAVWRALPEFQGRSQLSTWLHTLTSRTARRMFFRRQDTPTGEDLEHSLAPVASTEDDVLQVASDDAVRSAVADLPRDLGEPVALFHFEELSYPEIARRLDLPVATVRGRIYRGRRQLAAALSAWQ